MVECRSEVLSFGNYLYPSGRSVSSFSDLGHDRPHPVHWLVGLFERLVNDIDDRLQEPLSEI
jgi:hypothetical protein